MTDPTQPRPLAPQAVIRELEEQRNTAMTQVAMATAYAKTLEQQLDAATTELEALKKKDTDGHDVAQP